MKGVHRNKSELDARDAKYAKKWFTPIERGGNLNCKLKTFGFMDTLKVHIQSNYLTSTTLSLIQTKLAEKPETNFLCSLLFSFRF